MNSSCCYLQQNQSTLPFLPSATFQGAVSSLAVVLVYTVPRIQICSISPDPTECQSTVEEETSGLAEMELAETSELSVESSTHPEEHKPVLLSTKFALLVVIR